MGHDDAGIMFFRVENWGNWGSFESCFLGGDAHESALRAPLELAPNGDVGAPAGVIRSRRFGGL